MQYIEIENKTKKKEQLTNNHLDGLNANEWTCSIPFIRYLNSGQINALPA